MTDDDRNVPCKPRLVGGVPACRQALNLAWYRAGRKGHHTNEISFARILLATACPGGPALWAGGFNSILVSSLIKKRWKRPRFFLRGLLHTR
jgi:hypothetical protein